MFHIIQTKQKDVPISNSVKGQVLNSFSMKSQVATQCLTVYKIASALFSTSLKTLQCPTVNLDFDFFMCYMITMSCMMVYLVFILLSGFNRVIYIKLFYAYSSWWQDIPYSIILTNECFNL